MVHRLREVRFGSLHVHMIVVTHKDEIKYAHIEGMMDEIELFGKNSPGDFHWQAKPFAIVRARPDVKGEISFGDVSFSWHAERHCNRRSRRNRDLMPRRTIVNPTLGRVRRASLKTEGEFDYVAAVFAGCGGGADVFAVAGGLELIIHHGEFDAGRPEGLIHSGA